MDRESSHRLGSHRFQAQVLFVSNSRSLHALVNILGISAAEIAREVGLTRGRITHYTNEMERVPKARRREFISMLRDVLAAYEESIKYFTSDDTEDERPETKYLPAMMPVLRAMLKAGRKMADADEVELNAEDEDTA